MFQSINPATDERLARFPHMSIADREAALQRAFTAAGRWSHSPPTERTALLTQVAQVLRADQDRYARIITLEMGKPINEARAEIEKCALTCIHYAQHGAHYLQDETVKLDQGRGVIAFLPLGVILAIMPWNFPFWQVFRFAAAALTAGNTAVLKHAANVPQCALAIAEIFNRAGAAPGLFETLLLPSSEIANVIADSRIAAVTLTGSETAGRSVAAAAGAALKKTVLELGGSDAFIVLADADIEMAAKIAVTARFQNAGQSCIAAKRFILVPEIADTFLDQFIAHVRTLKQGNPLQEDVTLGPLARADLRDTLHSQVIDSIQAGAVVRLGCLMPQGPGSYYPASILDHIQPGMRAYEEELFGPVALILRATNEQDALRLANDTPYGLGASIWTRDLDRGEALARQIASGTTFVNGLVRSDPHLPFGGIKASGYGRELSAYGPREFTNIKTLWIGP